MPTYEFRNKETGETFEKFLSITNKEIYLSENKHIERIFTTTPAFGDSVRLGLKQTPDGFKEVLHKIASNNHKSNLKDKLSRN